MGRALRTTIPIPLEQLQPKLSNSKELRKKDKETKIKQKENYDNRHKTEQYNLEPGDEVWISDQGVSGEVENEQGPRSYQVRTSTGVVRRNRRDLNRLPSQDEHSSDETPITQFSTSDDTFQLRSLRQSKPPD